MRKLAIALLLFATGCVTVPRDYVRIDVVDNGHINVTSISDIPVEMKGREAKSRLAAMREAAVSGRDPWAVRYNRLDLSSERTTFEKSHGVITRVEHSATIANEDLSRLLADTNLTILFTKGDGWNELAIFPGTSQRATREQRQLFDDLMDDVTLRAANYLRSVDRLYRYLDREPGRAEYVLPQLYAGDEDSIVARDEEEKTLIVDVQKSLSHLLLSDFNDDDHAQTLLETANLVLDPFPGLISVKLPVEPEAVEGFQRDEGLIFEATMPTLVDAVASLEGHWIAPDPLAVAIRNEKKSKEDAVSELLRTPRHSTDVVTQADLKDALLEKLKPAPQYRVRWVVRRQPGE